MLGWHQRAEPRPPTMIKRLSNLEAVTAGSLVSVHLSLVGRLAQQKISGLEVLDLQCDLQSGQAVVLVCTTHKLATIRAELRWARVPLLPVTYVRTYLDGPRPPPIWCLLCNRWVVDGMPDTYVPGLGEPGIWQGGGVRGGVTWYLPRGLASATQPPTGCLPSSESPAPPVAVQMQGGRVSPDTEQVPRGRLHGT